MPSRFNLRQKVFDLIFEAHHNELEQVSTMVQDFLEGRMTRGELEEKYCDSDGRRKRIAQCTAWRRRRNFPSSKLTKKQGGPRFRLQLLRASLTMSSGMLFYLLWKAREPSPTHSKQSSAQSHAKEGPWGSLYASEDYTMWNT